MQRKLIALALAGMLSVPAIVTGAANAAFAEPLLNFQAEPVYEVDVTAKVTDCLSCTVSGLKSLETFAISPGDGDGYDVATAGPKPWPPNCMSCHGDKIGGGSSGAQIRLGDRWRSDLTTT